MNFHRIKTDYEKYQIESFRLRHTTVKFRIVNCKTVHNTDRQKQIIYIATSTKLIINFLTVTQDAKNTSNQYFQCILKKKEL